MTENTGRILALDYGKRRIGVAISDALGITAQPLDTWVGYDICQVVEEIQQLIQQNQVVEILVGMPLTLKGEPGEVARCVHGFIQSLKTRLNMKVTVWDERLTSKMAEQTMRQMGMKPSQNKAKIDRLAAVILLQSYLVYKEQNGLLPDGDGI